MRADKFPGWSVVTGCFIALATSSGLGFYGLAVYLNAFSKQRGWDVSSLSLATTWFFLVGGIAGVWIARLIARVDVRWVICAGGVLGGVSLALMGRITEVWQLFPVYGIFALGFASAGLVPVTTVVTRWFHVKRSVALSVASTGLSAGGVLLTPAAKWLLDERGLAVGMPWLGAVFVVGVVPTTLLLVRPDPAPLGWLPDGERSRPDTAAPAVIGVAFADAVSSRFFRAITFGYVLSLGAQVGAIQQLVKLVEERSDAETAAFATLAVASVSVIARLIGGRVATRVPMVAFTASLAVVQAFSMVWLAFAQSTVWLFAAILLFGATIGNILMLQPLLLAERFGVRDYPRIYSRSSLIALLGTAGGPIVVGWLHDSAGGYEASYVVAACFSLVGGALMFSAGSERPPADEHVAATVSTS